MANTPGTKVHDARSRPDRGALHGRIMRLRESRGPRSCVMAGVRSIMRNGFALRSVWNGAIYLSTFLAVPFFDGVPFW